MIWVGIALFAIFILFGVAELIKPRLLVQIFPKGGKVSHRAGAVAVMTIGAAVGLFFWGSSLPDGPVVPPSNQNSPAVDRNSKPESNGEDLPESANQTVRPTTVYQLRTVLDEVPPNLAFAITASDPVPNAVIWDALSAIDNTMLWLRSQKPMVEWEEIKIEVWAGVSRNNSPARDEMILEMQFQKDWVAETDADPDLSTLDAGKILEITDAGRFYGELFCNKETYLILADRFCAAVSGLSGAPVEGYVENGGRYRKSTP